VKLVEQEHSITMNEKIVTDIHSLVRAAMMQGFSATHVYLHNLSRPISNKLIDLQFKK
jgi:alanyl-tRNA synthetase